MADAVPHIVRKRSQRKCQLIDVLGIADQAGYKIAAANVVRQVAEKRMAEGIVPRILDRRAAICIRACPFQFHWCGTWIATEQHWNDGVFPCQVDDLLVRQHSITEGLFTEGEKEKKKRY